MHILAGESALRSLRAVRYRGLAVPVAQLTLQPQEARLPEQGKVAVSSFEQGKPSASGYERGTTAASSPGKGKPTAPSPGQGKPSVPGYERGRATASSPGQGKSTASSPGQRKPTVPGSGRGKPTAPGPERGEAAAPSFEQVFFPDWRTLADEGFPFWDVEANMRLELWQLGDVGPFTPERPLELAVFDRNRRTRGKKYRTREMPQKLPADALVRVNANLYFVCPELIVSQMAPSLSAIQLARLIMELCGTYSLSPATDQRRKAKYQLEPVTSLERIKRYSSLTKVRGGAKVLREALNYAMEGSASPSETVLALMMSLPRELGGYGFAKPALNASLTVPGEQIGHVGGTKYSLDAFWQDAYTDLEYESVEFHLDPLTAASLVAAKDGERNGDPSVEMRRREYIAKADADRRRLRDLQFLGIRVIPVTSFDLGDVRRLDQVALALAKNVEGPSTKGLEDWVADLDEGSYRERRRRLLRSFNDDAS